jgi:hypothetical protein
VVHFPANDPLPGNSSSATQGFYSFNRVCYSQNPIIVFASQPAVSAGRRSALPIEARVLPRSGYYVNNGRFGMALDARTYARTYD